MIPLPARLALPLLFAVLVPAQTLENCREARRAGRLAEETRCYQSLAASRDAATRAEALWAL